MVLVFTTAFDRSLTSEYFVQESPARAASDRKHDAAFRGMRNDPTTSRFLKLNSEICGRMGTLQRR
jgi:hypothetical protein